MHQNTLKQLISRYRSSAEAETYFAYRLESPQVLAEAARGIMSNVPPMPGSCALLSASWAGFLRDHHSIPAIVIAGDLKIGRTRVFTCKKNLPSTGKSGTIVPERWDGHCWIEVDGHIGDLSIFRTAYAIAGPNILKDYIVSKFGLGKGAMLCRHGGLPEGMRYIPKFVLTDSQVNGLIAGTASLLDNNG